jgi:hypothetical protein
MKILLPFIFTLLIPLSGAPQERKTPVSVGHTGKDQVGMLFVEAFNRELSHSTRYAPMSESDKGLRFFVDFISVDAADSAAEEGKKSVISVVIEDMGLPNSFPVPDMWYHKVIVVNRRSADETAKRLLEDMDARWCTYIHNFISGCPKEKLEPHLSPD